MAVITSKLIVALIDQVTAPARLVAQSVRQLEQQARSNAIQMAAMRGQMMDAAAAAYAVARGLTEPVKKAIEFESAMADVAKVSDFDEMGLNGFGKDLRRLAMSEIPMAATELAALAENAAASGVVGDELLDFTRMTAKAALAWGVSGGQAGEDLAKIREALRLTIPETLLYADAINHLADNTASQAPDLIKFSRAVAAQGEFYGYSKEQSLAFGSALISAGAETEVAATSFRNMGRALTKGASATDRVKKAYRTLGLDATKVAKAMQEDAVGTTMEVIRRLGQLPAEMQASVMSDLFGDEARALAPLLGNLDLLERTLGYVNDEAAYAGSVQAEFAKRMETTEFSLQRLKNQLDDVAMAIGNALLPAVQAGADVLGPWLMMISEWVQANEEIVRTVLLAVAGVVALRVAVLATRFAFLFLKGAILDTALVAVRGAMGFLALLNPMNLVKNAAIAVRAALMFSGVGLVLAGIAMAGMWIYNNWEGLGAFFEAFGASFMTAIDPIMPVLQPIIDAGKQILDWVMGLVGPVDASKEEWAGWGAVMGGAVAAGILTVVDAFKAVGKWISNTIAWAGDLASSLSSFVVSFVTDEIPAFLQWIKDIAGSVLGFYLDFYTGTVPAILGWVWDTWLNGASLLLNLPDIVLPPIIQWLKDIIGSVASFGISIDWPKPPDWLTWLMEEGAKLLGMGGQPSGPAPQFDPRYPDLPVPLAIDGANAVGGSIAGGKTYLVGEEGPELITPGGSGWVHTAKETAGLLGGGGGSGTVKIDIGGIHITGVTDPRQAADLVMRQLEDRLRDALNGFQGNLEYSG